ncbi:MAG TPA: 3-hydroxyacyl-CoA dehydrogenase NAD-binding domain-containing protein [Solirubrobacterales bacterium]|nr:3-hydroxyacyl-CoA dehydrogenase NAD-binding domain-containing protein [Solirubrobacterales bacterium]
MSGAPVGVLGAGTMGAGIAQVAALGGRETRLYDAFEGAAERGAERLAEALAKGVARGRWSEAEAGAARERVRAVSGLEELAGCGILIEAAPEDLALKRELFSAVAAVCGPEAVLASNTSSLRVADIAAGVPHPERVVGMHFFNPPALMQLVEVVAAPESAEWALAATTALGEEMGRTPIRAKDSPGFVANRLARPFSLESLRILADGVATAARIDEIVRGAGFRMGPFELLDLIGIDVNLTIARSFFAQGGEPERWRPTPVQEAMVAAGRFGRKSGAGFYDYENGEKTPADLSQTLASAVPSPSPAPQRNSGREEAGEEAAVLDRLFAQIANEAAFALEEEVASRADMDTAMRLGFNWPRGPIEIAAELGAERAVEILAALEAEKGAAYAAAPLLKQGSL